MAQRQVSQLGRSSTPKWRGTVFIDMFGSDSGRVQPRLPATRQSEQYCSSEMACYKSNAMPIRLSLRQATWQGRFNWSVGTIKVKRSGMKSGVTTSRAAPLSEMFLTVQSIAPPPNAIDPALSIRRRGAIRCSSIPRKYTHGLSR